jgi:hypothetical protein
MRKAAHQPAKAIELSFFSFLTASAQASQALAPAAGVTAALSTPHKTVAIFRFLTGAVSVLFPYALPGQHVRSLRPQSTAAALSIGVQLH